MEKLWAKIRLLVHLGKNLFIIIMTHYDSLSVGSEFRLYFKDLGPQVGWSTVFVAEYAGPLFIYLLFYLRPSIIYGSGDEVDKQINSGLVKLICYIYKR